MSLKDYAMRNIKNNKNIQKITYVVYSKDGTAKLISTKDEEFANYFGAIPKWLYMLVLYILIAIPLAQGIEITLTGFIGVYAIFNTEATPIGFLFFLQVIVGSVIIKFTRDAIVKFTSLYLEKRKVCIFSNKVPDNAKPMFCPHCGKTYYGDIWMCPHCNTIFDKNIKLFIGGAGAMLVLAGLMIAQTDITDIIAICLAKTEDGQYLELAPLI